MDRWLDRNQYRRIHAKAKKLEAKSVDTKHLSHCAYWKNFKVYFAFKPFKCMVAAIDTKPIDCDDIYQTVIGGWIVYCPNCGNEVSGNIDQDSAIAY